MRKRGRGKKRSRPTVRPSTPARFARAALASRPRVERIEALHQLAGHVLGPIGGLLPLEWETEWEELQP
jgi:hypothetical protein